MLKRNKIIFFSIFIFLIISICVGSYFYIKNQNLIKSKQQVLLDFNTNKLDDAITRAKELAENKSTMTDGLLLLATAYAQKGSVSFNEGEYSIKAIDAARKVLEIDPNNAEAYRLIGYSYEISQKYTDAQNNYLKAIELDPNLSQAYSGLGHSYNLQGDLVKAEEWYRKALSIDKNNFHALLNLARIDIKNNKPDEAEGYLQNIIKNNSNDRGNSDAYQLLSFIENSYRNNTVKSNEYLDKALTYDQNVPQVWVSIGMAALSDLPSANSKEEWNNGVSKAEDSVQKALAINKNQASAYLLSALLSSYLGDYKKAEEMRLKGLEVIDLDITLGQQEKVQTRAILESVNNLWLSKK